MLLHFKFYVFLFSVPKIIRMLPSKNVSLINSFKLYGFLHMTGEYIPNEQQQQQKENLLKSMGDNG